MEFVPRRTPHIQPAQTGVMSVAPDPVKGRSEDHSSSGIVPRWARRDPAPSILPLALLGTAVIAILGIGIGPVAIPPLTTMQILLSRFFPTTVDDAQTLTTILFEIRLPHIALIALSGASLASSGAAYQGLFRNPLADPYLIGVAAGASLGATVAIAMQPFIFEPFDVFAIPLGAFAGALGTVALVYALGRVGRRVPMTTLILAGVAIGSLMVSINTFLIVNWSGVAERTPRILAYLLGGSSASGWDAVSAIAPFAILGFAVMYLYSRPLNVLLFDEEQAQQLGVSVERVKLIIVVAATLTTAAAVAFSGLIGFVGLVVPHAARFLVGADHRRLLPLTAIGGAGFLMLADIIAQTILAPEILPLGVVTAFIGAPFFLYLLRRAKRAAFF